MLESTGYSGVMEYNVLYEIVCFIRAHIQLTSRSISDSTTAQIYDHLAFFPKLSKLFSFTDFFSNSLCVVVPQLDSDIVPTF